MAAINRFEELNVWQESRSLNKLLFNVLAEKSDKQFGFLVNHIFKTSGSIMDNIAEGYERDGNKEFIQFLSIAKASAGEFRSQLYRAFDFNLINQSEFNELSYKSQLISKQLKQFIVYLKNSNYRGNKFKEPENQYEIDMNQFLTRESET